MDQLASEEVLEKTIAALKQSGIEAVVVGNREEAKAKVRAMIPDTAEVMTMSSVTLEETGLVEMDTVKKRLEKMDSKTQGLEKRRLGTAPEWALGSVHAVTADGKVVIASNTGSQLPAYVYGAEHVVWVVGTQKIVENLDAAIKRVYEYVLPLEDAHMKRLYNVGSNVSKMLIVNKEIKPGRITVVFVKEKLGF